jgi:hypothetical protein
MRYAILAGLLFLVGIGITQLKGDEPYVPTVRVRTESGLFMTVVQSATRKRSACSETIGRLVAEVEKTCVGCSVESSECQSVLSGMEYQLASGAALPIYTISADGVRIAMLGAPKTIGGQCQKMAAKMAESGLPRAICVSPQLGEAHVSTESEQKLIQK